MIDSTVVVETPGLRMLRKTLGFPVTENAGEFEEIDPLCL